MVGMEDRNREKNGKLEVALGFVGGFGSALFHQIEMYKLMDKAGMYVTPETGEFSELVTSEGIGYQFAITAGCAALIFGGGYVGSRIGKAIGRLRRN